jgi:hypothetical protein
MAPCGFWRDREHAAQSGPDAIRRLVGALFFFMFQPLEESSLGFRLRPTRARVYTFGLFRGKRGNGLIDYGFVLPESLAAGWADRKVFLQPLLFFLAEMA